MGNGNSELRQKRPLQNRTVSEQVPSAKDGGGFFSKVGNLLSRDKDTQNQRLSTADVSQSTNRMSTTSASKDGYQMDPSIKYLPKKHDTKKLKQKRTERDSCELCEAPFSTKYAILNRNPVRHCKRCGKAVC